MAPIETKMRGQNARDPVWSLFPRKDPFYLTAPHGPEYARSQRQA